MTDYTNSILVKMFSKDNKEDAAKIKPCEKRNVGYASAVTSKTIRLLEILVLMANDINEINGTVRKDPRQKEKNVLNYMPILK